MTRRAREVLVAGCALFLVCSYPRAAQTRTWTGGAPELQRGDANGIAITSDGRLFLAPRLRRMVTSDAPSGLSHAWAEASDAAGNLFMGTGPDGSILKITPTGKQTVFFTVEEPMVTALAFQANGDLLAGTAPEGKIYRIHPDGKGAVWSKTGERYVWTLLVGKDGAVYAGTGEQGIIFRIGPTGDAQKLFDSDESHIVSLRALPDGWLLAGGAGRGLIYRIDPEGHGLVLHDDDLAEVKGLAVDRGGNVIAAVLASPEPERRPPAVRIQMTGGGNPTSEATGDLSSGPGVALEGVIEGLPAMGDSGTRGLRGHVIRLAPDGTSTELWRSSTETPLCLTLDDEGRALFGVGEPARIYRIEEDRSISLLATLREAQVTGLLPLGKDVAVATSNPAGAYVLEHNAAETGTFVSRPIDAGGAAHWGNVRWRAEGASGRVEVYTRTGNSEDPDGTWSAWSPALTNADGSSVVNPEGRFLQWRARLLGGGPAPAFSSTSVTFLARNQAPSIRDLRLESPSPAVSSKAALRWTASDPDGDAVAVTIQVRRSGSTEWKTAQHVEGSASDADAAQSWKEGKAVWDASGAEEGVYEVRAAADDDAANYPGEGRRDTTVLPDLLIVDRTPPVLSAHRTGGRVEASVTDALSPIVRLEVLEAGKVLFAVRPTDGVCDSRREEFTLAADAAGSGGARALRATDAAGNAAEMPIPAP